MLKISFFRLNPRVDIGHSFHSKSVWGKTAILAMGILSGLCFSSHSSQKIAFAANHDLSMQHVVDEILGHFIWEKVGSFVGIGHFATGFLGSLLTFQQLGEKDNFEIPKAIPKPIATFAMNPATKKIEHCIILANGKQLFGQDIIKFYQGLQFIQFVPSQNKAK